MAENGNGAGNGADFGRRGPDQRMIAKVAHNEFLTALARLSGPALLAVVTFLGIEVWSDVKALKRSLAETDLKTIQLLGEITGSVAVARTKIDEHDRRIGAVENRLFR